MQRKVLKHVGDDRNMIIFVESTTFFQRLLKKPPTVTKYVGSGTVWYILPSYTRAPTMDESWLVGQWRKLLNGASDLELLLK